MREFKPSDIGALLTPQISRERVHQIIEKFEMCVRNPHYIDSEYILVRAYIDKFRKHGMEAARKEIGRRIILGKEVRKLREMYLDNPKKIGYPRRHVRKSEDSSRSGRVR